MIDGCTLMRVVVFDEHQQDNLQKLEGHAAVLKNCHSQFSTYTMKMEIIGRVTW